MAPDKLSTLTDAHRASALSVNCPTIPEDSITKVLITVDATISPTEEATAHPALPTDVQHQ